MEKTLKKHIYIHKLNQFADTVNPVNKLYFNKNRIK